MAASVELRVNVKATSALNELDKVYAAASNIEKLSPIQLKIEATGLNNVTKEMIALAREQAKLQKAKADEARYNAQVTRSENDLERARVIHTKATKDETKATEDATQATQEFASSAESANRHVGLFAATLMHQLAQRAINAVRNAFREALTTMREVDQELANIQKVTDETDAVIAQVGRTAYDTASRYGIAANEYLESSAAFAKAGYDNYTQMAELATKTQLVGDVTAEVANKFLLSADAAFHFGGDMEALSQTLDKANIIENNYATSIQKLAQGFPLVAATASMANMTVDETLAAIGTITAKTQESGTMAARALRALILNILGDTQTEIEEGVTWTEAELKTLNGLLWTYAEEPMRQAQANGTVVNPMEAIKALHEAYATGVLTQKEISDIAMDLGGKLRTNQLVALIENYDTYLEMLDKTADSAGSADREIDVMLGTWNAKVNQLQNSWTELVSNIVETDTIKGAIDIVRGAVESLNDAINEAKNGGGYADDIKAMKDEIAELTSKGYLNLTELEKERLNFLREQTRELERQEALANKAALERWHLWNSGDAGLTTQGLQGQISSAKDQFLVDRNLTAYNDALDQLVRRYSEYYDKLNQVKAAGIELTNQEVEFIELYDRLTIAASASVDEVSSATSSKAELMAAQAESADVLIEYFTGTATQAAAAAEAVEEFNETARDDVTGLSLDELTSGWKTLWDSFVGAFGEVTVGIDNAESASEELTDAEGDAAEAASGIAENAGAIDFSAAISQVQALANAMARISGVAGPNINIGGGHAYGTRSAAGGPTLVNELGPELISDNGRAYIANGGRPGVVNLSPGAIVIPAKETEAALRGGIPSRGAAAGFNTALTDSGGGTGTALVTKALELIANAGKGGGPGSGRGGRGGSGGGRSKSLEELAKEAKDLLSNLDKQAKLANNEGDYAKEAQLYEQAQEAIKKMVDEYRSRGYADDSDEILDLLNKNYEYANKQLSLYQTKWDDLIDALEADTDAQKLANQLAEKQQAVEDAREALANAQKQRTIRMYNAATGQWEWVADQSKVASAQQSLATAEEKYADEVKSQAVKELEAMRDAVADLNEVILGPALSAVALMAEDSVEFQNFARALDAVYGVGSYLNTTEGTTKAISTADSHDTVYTFGNVTLTEEQASSMSVAQLAQKLSVLKIS